MENMNGTNDLNGTGNLNQTNYYDGMNTTGISAETFGVQSAPTDEQQERLGDYANSWTSGGYNVPGYNGIEPAPIKKEGRGLEIAALVFGILSLVVCCCNGFFGLIGLILSIVALVKGKRSGLSITGLICSVIALLLALSVLLFGMTDYGKELQEAFWEGFEEGFNEGMEEQYGSQYDDDIDYGTESDDSYTEEYEESRVEAHDGTTVISDKEAGKIVLDGHTFTIPCKLSEVLKYYSINEYSESDMSGGLDSYESKIIYLGEEQFSMYVTVSNYTEDKIEDINDAMVESVSVDDGANIITIFNGINNKMTLAELDEALKNVKYNKSEMSGYIFYNIFAGDDQEYSISIMLSEEKISNISVSHFDFSE